MPSKPLEPTDEEIAVIVANLKNGCPKSRTAYRAVRMMRKPLSFGQVSELAKKIGVYRSLVQDAEVVSLAFEAHEALRVKWEADILDGRINLTAYARVIAQQWEDLDNAKAAAAPAALSTPGEPLAEPSPTPGETLPNEEP